MVQAGCEISPRCSCCGTLHPPELPHLPVCVGGTTLMEAMEGAVEGPLPGGGGVGH